MSSSLLTIQDLGADGVNALLERADELRAGAVRPVIDGTIALVFLESSLRTRIGFAAAAGLLSTRVVEVYESRSGPTTSPESVSDTLRVVSGYADAMVLRAVDAITLATDVPGIPVLNAGDRSAQAEHPSQALIDLFAIRTMLARPCRHLVLWGDPTMRSARSLLSAVALTGAADRVTIVSDETYLSEFSPPEGLSVQLAAPAEPIADDTDVLYATGMPHGSIDLDRRELLIVSTSVLDRTPTSATVLSPMPVIDEISPEARQDPRVRFFEQSDLALWMRIAVLERLLTRR